MAFSEDQVCNVGVPQQEIKTLLKFQSALKQTTLSLCLKSTFLCSPQTEKIGDQII